MEEARRNGKPRHLNRVKIWPWDLAAERCDNTTFWVFARPTEIKLMKCFINENYHIIEINTIIHWKKQYFSKWSFSNKGLVLEIFISWFNKSIINYWTKMSWFIGKCMNASCYWETGQGISLDIVIFLCR